MSVFEELFERVKQKAARYGCQCEMEKHERSVVLMEISDDDAREFDEFIDEDCVSRVDIIKEGDIRRIELHERGDN